MLLSTENTPQRAGQLSKSVGISPRIIYKPFSKKTTFICKFCGGKSCKHENWLTYPESAIKGLNSDWITPNILATQRPSSRIIKEYNITEAFLENGINAIFNLQEPGEHPFCGDGIHPQSGFSYYPEEFYEHGIYYFNFGWKDMTATSTDIVLKILKQMSFSLTDGNKIAIHCHAGRGRTGLIIAAWLIYNNNMTAKEAIKHIRNKRKGAIQNKAQEELLYRLEKEIRESRIIFHSAPKFKLEEFLFHQKKLLPLSYESENRFIPILVLTCLERLETLLSSGICKAKDIILAFSNPNDHSYFKGEWASSTEKQLKALKERINSGNFQISDIDDPRYLAQAMLDHLDQFTSPAIQNQFIESIHNEIHNKDKLTKEMKEEVFRKLDKKEFLLVERFVRFFAKLSDQEDENIDDLRKAVLRLCVSLVLGRKKWDKLFYKRSLIQEHTGDDQLTHLHVIMLKWIENFNNNFTEFYIVNKSPLKINEKMILEKLSPGFSRRGSTYLARQISRRKSDSERATPSSYSVNDQIKIIPPEITDDYVKNLSQQINQENKLLDLVGHSSTGLLGTTQLETPNNGFFTPKLREPSGTAKSKEMNDLYILPQDLSCENDSNADTRSEGENVSNRNLFRIHSNPKSYTPRYEKPNDYDFQDKIPGAIVMPSKFKSQTILLPRKSLFRGEDRHNSFASGKNEEGVEKVEKKYDDFFSGQGQNDEESQGDDNDSVSDASDNVKAEEEKFNDLLAEIDKLNPERQDIILEKLLKLKQARTRDTANKTNEIITN